MPTYLNTATKIDLQKDIDEINNLVKVHHEIYDNTNWETNQRTTFKPKRKRSGKNGTHHPPKNSNYYR